MGKSAILMYIIYIVLFPESKTLYSVNNKKLRTWPKEHCGKLKSIIKTKDDLKRKKIPRILLKEK